MPAFRRRRCRWSCATARWSPGRPARRVQSSIDVARLCLRPRRRQSPLARDPHDRPDRLRDHQPVLRRADRRHRRRARPRRLGRLPRQHRRVRRRARTASSRACASIGSMACCSPRPRARDPAIIDELQPAGPAGGADAAPPRQAQRRSCRRRFPPRHDAGRRAPDPPRPQPHRLRRRRPRASRRRATAPAPSARRWRATACRSGRSSTACRPARTAPRAVGRLLTRQADRPDGRSSATTTSAPSA